MFFRRVAIFEFVIYEKKGGEKIQERRYRMDNNRKNPLARSPYPGDALGKSLHDGASPTGKMPSISSYRIKSQRGNGPLPALSETELRVLRFVRAGLAGNAISRLVDGRSPEIVVRLVERRIGALGKVEPLPPGGPSTGNFGPDGRQAPVLRLAARALGPTLRRLGDRVYLNDEETDIPAVVAAARARGVRIRYPGLDPIDTAFAAGPSASAPRRRTAIDLTGFRP